MSEAARETIRVRAAANKWISDHFPNERRFLGHAPPVRVDEGWRVALLAWPGKQRVCVGHLAVEGERAVLMDGSCAAISDRLAGCLEAQPVPDVEGAVKAGRLYSLAFGDGIAGAAALEDRSVDLLLTDPPYGISAPYACEGQVPRRLRKNGADFIMPRGHFGGWDEGFPLPGEWTSVVLPKVRGWAVIFCAQVQIGDYAALLAAQKFVAVGTLVWQKTNPVPFNHKFKPINAWEAVVVGKRPGTKFNGRLVHNVFLHKSPSPQQRIHPTQKPESLISEFVTLFSSEGGLVLDPFAGSATTVVAGVRLGRRVLAYENDPRHFEASVRRLEDLEPPL